MKKSWIRSHTKIAVSLSLALGGALALVSLLVLSGVSSSWAAPSAELHVCPGACIYPSVQAAVDAAQPGDVIKVADGMYSDIHVREGITQVAYINKSVTIRGGYAQDDWATPCRSPTPLDGDSGLRMIDSPDKVLCNCPLPVLRSVSEGLSAEVV